MFHFYAGEIVGFCSSQRPALPLSAAPKGEGGGWIKHPNNPVWAKPPVSRALPGLDYLLFYLSVNWQWRFRPRTPRDSAEWGVRQGSNLLFGRKHFISPFPFSFLFFLFSFFPSPPFILLILFPFSPFFCFRFLSPNVFFPINPSHPSSSPTSPLSTFSHLPALSRPLFPLPTKSTPPHKTLLELELSDHPHFNPRVLIWVPGRPNSCDHNSLVWWCWGGLFSL